MQCTECGAELPAGGRLCSQCGTLVEQTQPTQPAKRSRRLAEDLATTQPVAATQVAGEESSVRPIWPRMRPWLLGAAGVLIVVLVAIGGGAYAGLYLGEQDRAEQRSAVIEQHYQAGIHHLDEGNFHMALAEFEYVLRLDPDHGLAAQGVSETQARMVPTPTPLPTAEPLRLDPAELLARGQQAHQAGDWIEAARALTQLRGLDRSYQQSQVEELLFQSLYRAGLELLASDDRIEEGIFYLDQAAALRPLDADAQLQHDLAEQYMGALGYWGVDWDECLRRFEALYAAAPGYRDVFSRLYQARLAYAELFETQGEMCPAQLQYEAALRLVADAGIEEQRAGALAICLAATPTPLAPITGTETISGTLSAFGFNVGRLAYPRYNTTTGLQDIYAMYPDGRIVQAVQGGDQPGWQWGTDWLVYRNRVAPGVYAIMPGQESPRVVRAGAEIAWPSLSPDGNRLAYAADDAGTWRVYIVAVDGSTEPVAMAEGWAPNWGPTGLLAYTGCEPGGGTCGIFFDNPDDPEPPLRITASEDDTAVSWGPGGGLLAYMSDASGDWEIYMAGINGGVQALTQSPGIDALPTWAPDGSAIAFVSNRDGNWGLYLMGPLGENPRKVVDLGAELPNWQNQRLAWAP